MKGNGHIEYVDEAELVADGFQRFTERQRSDKEMQRYGALAMLNWLVHSGAIPGEARGQVDAIGHEFANRHWPQQRVR